MRTTAIKTIGAEPAPAPAEGPFLTTKGAAGHLSLSPRTLEKHRVAGTGPRYRKHGGKVVYLLHDLDEWSSRGNRGSTSDPGLPNAPRPYRHGLPGGSKPAAAARS